MKANRVPSDPTIIRVGPVGLQQMTTLEPLSPREGKELYLNDRAGDLAVSTHRSHGYRIERFCEWCEANNLDNLNNLTGRHIHRYKITRKSEVDSTNTVKSHLDTLRVFLRYMRDVDAVGDDIPEKVNSPSLNPGEGVATDTLDAERADDILDQLRRFEWASRRHVVLELLWATSIRNGTLRSFDLEDYYTQEAYIEARHRKQTDTPLKNKQRGERAISLTSHTCDVIDDYIEVNRNRVRDEYDRKPLITTKRGRISTNTVRAYVYRCTRPCEWSGDCPHGRERDSCEAVQSRMSGSKCPDSVGSHAVRRGSITHHLNENTPKEVVSDRADVGVDVLEKHYDARSEKEKMEQRRDYLPD